MIATSGDDASPLGRHSTAPAARTDLLTGTAAGGSSFDHSTPAGHPGGVMLLVTDAGGVPSATPDGRARSGPRAVTPSSFRRHRDPSSGSRGPSRTRRL